MKASHLHQTLPTGGRYRTIPWLLATPVLAVVLAACRTVGPDYQSPEATVPSAWREAAEPGFGADAAESEEWWTQLNDPVLSRLIERGLDGGLDLRESFARMREARALRGATAADRFPALEAAGSYWRSGESERTPVGALVSDSHLYAVGLDAAWEIDLWGRIRRAVEAADAELAASVEDTRDVALALVAETAANYVELRAFQRRLAIARTNVELQEQTLFLVESRFDAGLVGERDVAQAATNVAVTRSRVPALETGQRAAENRLSILLGLTPGALADELDASRPIPIPPVTAAVGVPADVIRKRPDVRRAERLLAAEHARIGVATADRYPQLSLSGSLGLAADDAADVFRSGSNFFGIGPSVRWSLFDGARLRRRVEAQDARTEQAMIQWERTVLTALEESENAMTALVRGQLRRESLLEAAVQARRAVELAQFEYNEGLSDFQAVLDSERALAQLEDELAQADASIATQFIALRKALGG